MNGLERVRDAIMVRLRRLRVVILFEGIFA